MSDFKCPMCNEKTYHGAYSQGTKVCLDCKKITQADDDRAFDNDWHMDRMGDLEDE